MKPNQQQYEKYFRRPLAWLLSFGMLASYVPAAHGQEGETTEKDARTYYEDAPVGLTASTAMIPMAETETEVVEETNGEPEPEVTPDTTRISLEAAIAKAKAVVDENGNPTFDGTLPAGNYELTDDLDLGEFGYNLKFVGTGEGEKVTVTLDLQGNTLTGATDLADGNDYGSVIYLEYVDFTLISTEATEPATYDSQDNTEETKGTITGGTGYTDDTLSNQYFGGGIYAKSSNVTIESGAISGNTAGGTSGRGLGGGLYATGFSNIILNGGSVSNNTTNTLASAETCGGGIYIAGNATLTMNDGDVSSNHSSFGDGILIEQASSFTYNGGTVKDNTGSNDSNDSYSFFIGCNSNFTLNGAYDSESLDPIYLDGDAVISLENDFSTTAPENDFSTTAPFPIKMKKNAVFTSGAGDIDNAHIYFTPVDDHVFVLWETIEIEGTETNELKIGTLSLGFDNSDYVADADEDNITTLTVSINSEDENDDSIETLFTSLEELQEQIKTAYKLDNMEKVTVEYYKKKDNSQEAQTISRTIDESNDWELLVDGENNTAQAQAQTILAEAGGEIKVAYSVPDGEDGATKSVAEFVITSENSYNVTTTTTGSGTVEITSEAPEDEDQDGGGGGATQSLFTISEETTETTQKVVVGDTVTITTEPDEGYELSEITVTYTEDGVTTTLTIPEESDDESSGINLITDPETSNTYLTETDDNTYSFTMPEADVTIKVTFDEVEEEEEEEEITYPHFSVTVDGDTITDGETIMVEVEDSKIDTLVLPDVDIKVDTDDDEDDYSYTIEASYYDDSEGETVTLDITALDLTTVKAYLEKEIGNEVTVTLTMVNTSDSSNVEDANGGNVTFSFTWESVEDEEDEEVAPEGLEITLDGYDNGSKIYVEETKIPSLKALDYTLTLDGVAITGDGLDEYKVDIQFTDKQGGEFETLETARTHLQTLNNEVIVTYLVTATDDSSDSPEILASVTITLKSVADGYEAHSYNITLTVGENGSVLMNNVEGADGEDRTITVQEGSSVSFLLVPIAGYQLDEIKVNGDVVPQSEYEMGIHPSSGVTYYTYTIDSVEKAYSVEVSFEAVPTNSITLDYGYSDLTWQAEIEEDGTLIEDLPDLNTRQGYKFEGWYTSPTDGTEVTSETTFTNGETIYAKWSVDVYEITFQLEGGTVATTGGENLTGSFTYSTSDSEANKWTLPHSSITAVIPTKENAVFKGWYLDGGITKVDHNYKFSSNSTIYAHWYDLYDITFDYNFLAPDASTSQTATFTTGIDGKIENLPEPQRDGYQFEGWYTGYGTDSGGWGSPVTTDSVFGNNSPDIIVRTVYAKWTQIEYKLTLDYNYGENNTTTVALNSQGELADSLPKPERDGYTFTDWYYDENCSDGKKYNDERFPPNDAPIGSILGTLYAKWFLETYTVTFDPNYTDSEGEDAKTYTADTTDDGTHILAEKDQADPVRSGYDFLGWYDNVDFNGEKIDLANTPFYEDTTLYAFWFERTDTIKLDANGGVLADNISAVKIVSDTGFIQDFAAFSAIEPTRIGYTFDNWSTLEVALGETRVDADTKFEENDTIYAQWTAIEYTLNFDLNDGIKDDDTVDTPVMPPITVTYDQPIGTLEGGKKQNATFAGWHLLDDDGDLALDSSDGYIILDADTIWNYTEDQNVIAKYNFAIKATVQGEGGIVKAGDHTFTTEDHTIYLFEGSDQTFDFEVDPGYRIASITIDGTTYDRDVLAEDINYKNNTSYTLVDLQAGTEIIFELELVPIYEIEITTSNGSYATSSNEDTENNIVFGTEGDDVSITFTPDRGYYIASASANGEIRTVSDSDSPYPTTYTYKVTDIMNDVALEVVIQELPRYTLTATSGENGSIDATNKYIGDGLVNDKMEIYHGEEETFVFYPSVGYEVDAVTVSDTTSSLEVTASTSYTMTSVTENTKIHVTFKEILEETDDIVVTLHANGGTLDGVSSVKVTESGTLESMPSNPTRTDYIFNGWWNADNGGTQIFTSTVFTQNTTIYAQWVEDLTGVDYTVTFESNGGTTISNQLVSANGSLSKPTDPTRTGYTFSGWYTTSLLTTAWDFSDDIVSKDMTLYAKWTANATDSSTSVSRVVDHNGNPVVGATVTLMRNGSTYYSATTDSDGYYAFSLLVAGSYNLVVTTLDGYEKTTAVTIYNSSTTLPLVQLPEHNISSTSSISTGSLAQVVGGLDTLANLIAAKTSNFSKVLVDIAISSYTSTSSQSTITNAKQSTDVIASFFDVDLTKTVTTTTGLTYSDAITDADSLVEIVLSIPTVYQGKDSYSIYRIHNGSVDRITSSYNSNSERVVLSSDGTKLSLFVKKFSAYALAYADNESTTTSEHDVKITSYLNGVESSSTSIGSVAVSSSTAAVGDVVTVTPYPNFGFSLDNVVVKTDAGKYLTVTTNSNGTYSFAQTSSNATVYVYFTTTLNSTGNSLTDSNTSTSPQISYFSDVNVTDTFCSAINEVVSLGLMSGTGNGTFSPHDSITRGMIVSILQYMSGEKTTLTPGFSDVYPSDYYYYAVAWGEASGMISGYDDNTYRPNQAITREELAAILYRYSQKYGNYDVLWYFPLSFSDTESVTFWAKDAVTWCVNRDVLSARYNNFFLPQAVSTRAEVAVAVVALLNSQS